MKDLSNEEIIRFDVSMVPFQSILTKICLFFPNSIRFCFEFERIFGFLTQITLSRHRISQHILRKNSTRNTTQHGEFLRLEASSQQLSLLWNAFRILCIDTFLTCVLNSSILTLRHVIVGRNFGSYVTHETKHFIYFYLGQVAVLLFKR
jgi:hypothetical protein